MKEEITKKKKKKKREREKRREGRGKRIPNLYIFTNVQNISIMTKRYLSILIIRPLINFSCSVSL